MHGTIVFQYKKFIINNFGFDIWHQILMSVGARDSALNFYENMDDETFFQVFANTLEVINMPAEDTLEAFGQYISAFLIKMYEDYVENDWKTMEVLEKTEAVMHTVVRKSIIGEKASPPILSIKRVSDKEIQMIYKSEKNLGHLGLGIIRGISKYYHEENTINVQMNPKEDSTVEFLVSRTA